MKLIPLFVKRPVMTSMVFLGVFLFGVLSYTRLSQELFPNVSVPQLVVITHFASAAPEEIENLITRPVEEAVGTVPNLKGVHSKSKEGISAVTLEFAWGTDLDLSHLAVREKLDRMKDKLPQEAEEPIIKRVNPFSKPVMILSVTGSLPLADLTEVTEDIIKKKLEKTDGVGTVVISGGQSREILVEVDRGRLEASQISLPMVVEALKNANYTYPAGTAQNKTTEFLLRVDGRFQSIDDIQRTVVQVEHPELDPVYQWKKGERQDRGSAPREKRLIPLSSLVSNIEETTEDRTTYSRFNGKQNISISILKQADANSVAVSKAVKEAMDEIMVSLPTSLAINVVYDESDYILAALGSMRNNVLFGGLLAFLVLLFFLGTAHDALNVGLAIPVSILLVFIIMFLGGLSVNVLTLAGLALAVGTLSDAAIVVAENISRHHKQLGKPLMTAAVEGTEEMVGSMTTAALTNIAVFFPLLFIRGMAQQLFQDLFAVTVFTALAGLFVSLTLIPRMAAYNWTWLKKLTATSNKRFMLTEEKRQKMNSFYGKSLVAVLKKPGIAAQIILPLTVLALFILFITPRVFMPRMDQGQFIVELDMPIGTRLEITNQVAAKLENLLLGVKGVDVVVNVGSAQDDEDIEALGPHQAHIVVTLGPAAHTTTSKVLRRFQDGANKENLEGGELIYLLQDSPLRAALSGGAPISIEIKGPEFDVLREKSREIQRKLELDPRFFSVKSSMGLPSRESKVVVDKDRAGSHGLTVAEVARTAMIAIKGVTATEFKKGGKEINIRVRLQEADRKNVGSIRRVAMRTPRGEMVPLDSVAEIKMGQGNSEILRLDQQRAVRVSAEVAQGNVDDALDAVEGFMAEINLPADYTMKLSGERERMAESFGSLKYTFILAILIVFMIMAADFESIKQPLVIMITVPFSFIGVAFTLFITNTPLSSVVVLGVLILAGLVVNNGIVLIDHINKLRENGKALGEAVILGSVDRLRPILMTTATTLMAVFPLAIGLGRGDDLAQPLAVVTLGGLFVSTLLTLYVVPLLYFEIAKRK